MTANKFRSLALSFPGAFESEHMGHPDFRVEGKIFTTLGCPDEKWGMVKFTLAQQQEFLRKAPDVFNPCKGMGARPGATNVHLASAKAGLLRVALKTAWSNATAKMAKP